MPYFKQLETAKFAAKEAGKILLENFSKPYEIKQKGERKEFVTEIDLKSEKRILSILKKEFPEHSILSEEAGEQKKKSEFTWFVDPLDGTTNYKIKNPFFNVSIGLAKGNSVIVGVVYSPFLDELFYSEIGKGAFLNGKKIHVSGRSDIKSSVIGFCHSGRKPEFVDRGIKIFSVLKKLSSHTRQFGAAALEFCYLAAGRIDVFEVSNANSYDVAAGALIAKEAGATITDFKGGYWDLSSEDILVTNGKLHKEVIDSICKL